jgi:hypothetical protein
MGTTTLTRSLLTDVSHMGIITDALGDNSQEYSDTELGKGVVIGAAAYVAAGLGDQIEGIVNTVEPGTRNAGFSWGGIQTTGRALATVGSAQTGTVAVGEVVCNGAAIAPGTAGLIQVMSVGTGFVAPTEFFWRVIRILSGTGVIGDSIMIERV